MLALIAPLFEGDAPRLAWDYCVDVRVIHHHIHMPAIHLCLIGGMVTREALWLTGEKDRFTGVMRRIEWQCRDKSLTVMGKCRDFLGLPVGTDIANGIPLCVGERLIRYRRLGIIHAPDTSDADYHIQ